MNRNKKYTDSKKSLLERNQQLELENQKLLFKIETIQNILGVPRTVIQEPLPSFDCSLCGQKSTVAFQGQQVYTDENGNRICHPCWEYSQRIKIKKTTFNSEKKDRSEYLNSEASVETSKVERPTTKSSYVPPTNYNLNDTSLNEISPVAEEKEEEEIRETADGIVRCYCGEIATQIKKTPTGTLTFCPEHKEEDEMNSKLKPDDIKEQVYDASAKKYRARTQEIQVDCASCGKTNLEGYWNNDLTNKQNFCHDCYKKTNPEVANPKCEVCNKQDETVGWFEALQKNYCEKCARTVMDNLEKKK